MSTVPSQNAAGRKVSRHRIRDDVLEMILTGRKGPGTKLVQQELAREFGVAQGVVREALFELQAYGLVKAIDNRGLFVNDLDEELLIESLDVRAAHEALSVRLCCDRITRMELRELAQLAEEIYAHGVAGRYEQVGPLDREFHQRLIERSGNRMLIRLSENHRILGKVVQLNRDPAQVRTEHLGIVSAIERNQPEEAERLALQHIWAARQIIRSQINEGTFVPRWVRAGDPAGSLQAQTR